MIWLYSILGFLVYAMATALAAALIYKFGDPNNISRLTERQQLWRAWSLGLLWPLWLVWLIYVILTFFFG